MSRANEVIDEETVARMDLGELKGTTREIDVDPDELAETIPGMAHHMTVRGKLEALVDHEAISYSEMDQVYGRWKESKQ